MRRNAKGTFTLDGRVGHKDYLLVCTVTGVAPYVSMARTLAREARLGHHSGAKLVVLQAASRSWEFAYRDELESLAREFPWIRYVPVVSRPWEDRNGKAKSDGWKTSCANISTSLSCSLRRLRFIFAAILK